MHRLLSRILLVPLSLLVATAYASSPAAIHTFACNSSLSSCPQGASPEILIQGSDGNFYGATQASSQNTSQPNGGTIFSITPAGKFTLLHTFLPGSNSSYPEGSVPAVLVESPEGNLYGTTFYGGTGFGVVFRMSKQGSGFQIIHQFGSTSTDGLPGGSLVLAQDGNLYGTTAFGGSGTFCYGSCGTIYRVTPSSATYEVVFNFDGDRDDGYYPSGLTVAPDGSLIGLSNGLFHYTPETGALKLDPFRLPAVKGEPAFPFGLTIGPNGKVYGLYSGYSVGGAGLFEVDLDGSNVHEFSQYRSTRNSGDPSELLLATDGNFWVPEFTGSNGLGDLLVLTPSTGTILKTISFSASTPTGTNPGKLIQAKDGTFWGTTAYGGNVPANQIGSGVVYKLKAGLPAR